LVIEEATYTASIDGRSLELTFKEFELLKYLARHPGRVFTRADLLREVGLRLLLWSPYSGRAHSAAVRQTR
jgi:DNA-binding response OmpR family regulator